MPLQKADIVAMVTKLPRCPSCQQPCTACADDDGICCVACQATWYDAPEAKKAQRVERGWERRVAKLPAADDMRRAGFRRAVSDHVQTELAAARAAFVSAGRPLPTWLQVTDPSAEASP